MLAILYQNYRSAFADLFLKHVLTFLFLTVFILIIYLFLVAPLLGDAHKPSAARVAVIIGFGAASAFAYPKLRFLAIWFVDRVLMRRVPFDCLQTEIIDRISTLEPVEAVLTEIKEELARALTAMTAIFRGIHRQPDSSPAVNASLVNAAVRGACRRSSV